MPVGGYGTSLFLSFPMKFTLKRKSTFQMIFFFLVPVDFMNYVCAGNISINRRHPLRTRLAFWRLGMQEPVYLPAPTR